MREVQSDAQLRLLGCTAQHRGDRAEQQDRVAVLASARAPRCALGVLADGVGGCAGGALAAENVVRTSARRFDDFAPGDDAGAFFLGLVDELNTVLHVAGATAGLSPHSTFAAILVQPDRVDWCHVGDSRVYHVRDGRLLHCTIDHSVAGSIGKTLDGAGVLHAAGIAANTLTGALGTRRAPQPTLGGMCEPRAGDTFLLCSDGLWNPLAPDEIARELAGRAPRAAAERLVEAARARAGGRGDNCSLVLLSVTSAPATTAGHPAAAAPLRPAPSDDGSARARAPRAA